MASVSDKDFYNEDFVLKIDHEKKLIHCGHVEGEALNYDNLPNLLVPPSTTDTDEVESNPNGNDDNAMMQLQRPNHSRAASNQIIGPKQFGDKSSEQDDTIDSIFFELDNQFDNDYFEGPFHGNVYVRWDTSYYRDVSGNPGSSIPPDLEEPVASSSLINLDRYHQLSDVVKHRASGKTGVITKIKKKAIAEIVSANKLIVDFDCSKLKSIEKFFSGTTEQIVVYKSWLGKVTDIVRHVILQFTDGAKLRVSIDGISGFQPLFNEDHAEMVFHGACLHGDPKYLVKSIYKKFIKESENFNANWLTDLRRSKQNNTKVEVLITKVILFEATIDWFMYKPRSNESEGSVQAPPKQFRGKRIKDLKSLNSKPYLYMYAGDIWYYPLKAEDKIYNMENGSSVSKMLYRLYQNDNVKPLRVFPKPRPRPISLSQKSDFVNEEKRNSRSIPPKKTLLKISRNASGTKKTLSDKKENIVKQKSSLGRLATKKSPKKAKQDSVGSNSSYCTNQSNSIEFEKRVSLKFKKKRGLEYYRHINNQRKKVKLIHNRCEMHLMNHQLFSKPHLITINQVYPVYVQCNLNNVDNRKQSTNQPKNVNGNDQAVENKCCKHIKKNPADTPVANQKPKIALPQTSPAPKSNPTCPTPKSNQSSPTPTSSKKKISTVTALKNMPTVTRIPVNSTNSESAGPNTRSSHTSSKTPTFAIAASSIQHKSTSKKKKSEKLEKSPVKTITKKSSIKQTPVKLTRQFVINNVYHGLQVGSWVPLQIMVVETLVDVTWEDGTTANRIPSVDLVPQLFDIDDYDFFPGDFVEFKKPAGDVGNKENDLKFGCVITANNMDRMATVQWFKDSKKGVGNCTKQGKADVCGSYNIRHHPDYPYHVGEFVMIQAECTKTNHPAGYICSLNPSKGLLRVTWPDLKESELYPTEFSGIMLDIYSDDIGTTDTSTDDSIDRDETRDNTEIQPLPEDYETKKNVHEIVNIVIDNINMLVNLDLGETNTGVTRSDKNNCQMCAIKDNMNKIKEINYSKSLNLIYDSYYSLIFPVEALESTTTNEAMSICHSILSGRYINLESPTVHSTPNEGAPELPSFPLNLGHVNLNSASHKYELHNQIKSRLLNLKTSLKHWTRINTLEMPRPERSTPNTAQMNITPETVLTPTGSPAQLVTTSGFQQRPFLMLAREAVNQGALAGGISVSPNIREDTMSQPQYFLQPNSDAAQISAFVEVTPSNIVPLRTDEIGSFEMASEGEELNFYYKMGNASINNASFLKTWNKEQNLLKTSLPKGIWVKTFESRLDLLSVMIEGPHGTPYQYGLFFFDIYLPMDYPQHPPLCHFLSNPSKWSYSTPNEAPNTSTTPISPTSTSPQSSLNPQGPAIVSPSSPTGASGVTSSGHIGVINTSTTNTIIPEHQTAEWLNRFSISPYSLADRLNPNLYPDGRVCLSLLGTWIGRGNENWNPLYSNLLQLFVSIQGLILVSEPYFNEAGYDGRRTTKEGQFNSRRFNESIISALVISSINLLKNPLPSFKKEITQYYQDNGKKYVSELKIWVNLTDIDLKDINNQRQNFDDKTLKPNDTMDNQNISDATMKEQLSIRDDRETTPEPNRLKNMGVTKTKKKQESILPKFSLVPVSKGFQISVTKYIGLLEKTLQDTSLTK